MPQQMIPQVVNPPSTDITTRTTPPPASTRPTDVGLVTVDQLTSGKWLAPGRADEVLVNASYAHQALEGRLDDPDQRHDYTSSAWCSPTLTGNTADLYFPFATLQDPRPSRTGSRRCW